MKPSRTVLYAALILFILFCPQAAWCKDPAPSKEPRPATWAVPLELEGVPNLHKVSDILYRSAQPTAPGMKNLEKMGIKTVLNLRSFHSDQDEMEGTSMHYEHLTMKAWHPEDKEIVHFLKLISNPEKTPLLVHCKHGADRTGTNSRPSSTGIASVAMSAIGVGSASAQPAISGATDDSVSTTRVPASAMMPARRCCALSRPSGSGAGTATTPAAKQPRNAATKGSPGGYSSRVRSPGSRSSRRRAATAVA